MYLIDTVLFNKNFSPDLATKSFSSCLPATVFYILRLSLSDLITKALLKNQRHQAAGRQAQGKICECR